MKEINVREYMEEFRAQWHEHLGSTGDDLARDLSQLVDVILAEFEAIVRENVASWALVNSDEKIPLSKISKEGLVHLLANPEYISNGELFEVLKTRLLP